MNPSPEGSVKRVASDANMSPFIWKYLNTDKFRTTSLINLAGIMERMDEQILPALYNFIGLSFHATPSQLGTLTLCRALVQALSSPIGGLSGTTCLLFPPSACLPCAYASSMSLLLLMLCCLSAALANGSRTTRSTGIHLTGLCIAGHYYNRVKVTTLGCIMWGVCTAGFSMCASLRQGYFFWAINGIGLSLVIPTGQSLIADYYQASNRGKAFGALYLTGSLGGMFGSMYATNLGSSSATTTL